MGQFNRSTNFIPERIKENIEEKLVTDRMQEEKISELCPKCGAAKKYNNFNSGLPLVACSNIDCDWSD